MVVVAFLPHCRFSIHYFLTLPLTLLTALARFTLTSIYPFCTFNPARCIYRFCTFNPACCICPFRTFNSTCCIYPFCTFNPARCRVIWKTFILIFLGFSFYLEHFGFERTFLTHKNFLSCTPFSNCGPFVTQMRAGLPIHKPALCFIS